MSRRITGYILNESGQDDYIWQRERINRVFDGIPVLFRGEDVYEGEDKHLMYIDALAEDHKKGDLIVMDRISRVSGSPEKAAEFYMNVNFQKNV